MVATMGLRLAGAQWLLSLQVLYNVFESFVALGGDNVTGVDCVKGIGMSGLRSRVGGVYPRTWARPSWWWVACLHQHSLGCRSLHVGWECGSGLCMLDGDMAWTLACWVGTQL